VEHRCHDEQNWLIRTTLYQSPIILSAGRSLWEDVTCYWHGITLISVCLNKWPLHTKRFNTDNTFQDKRKNKRPCALEYVPYCCTEPWPQQNVFRIATLSHDLNRMCSVLLHWAMTSTEYVPYCYIEPWPQQNMFRIAALSHDLNRICSVLLHWAINSTEYVPYCCTVP
jgi:hypothetical protein